MPPSTSTSSSSDPFILQGQDLDTFLPHFWERQIATAENEEPDVKNTSLPLARIKKVMKSDPDVKMISADAPLLFAKACEVFIAELSARAYIVAESNKRRTITRADIAAAAAGEMFDFLIDFFLPEERRPNANPGNNAGGGGASSSSALNAGASTSAKAASSSAARGRRKRKNSAVEDHDDHDVGTHLPSRSLEPSEDASTNQADSSSSTPILSEMSTQQRRRRASTTASKKPRKRSMSGIDATSEHTLDLSSPISPSTPATISDWRSPTIQSGTFASLPVAGPSNVSQAYGEQQAPANASAMASSSSGAGFKLAELDESNVFYHQIQAYIHAPHPPQTRIALPPAPRPLNMQQNPVFHARSSSLSSPVTATTLPAGVTILQQPNPNQRYNQSQSQAQNSGQQPQGRSTVGSGSGPGAGVGSSVPGPGAGTGSGAGS